MLAQSSVETMRREMRVRYGPVASSLEGELVQVGNQLLGDDAFLLRSPGGIDFYYCKGEGVTIFRAPETTSIEEELYLNGSVYSAVACINGLFPLHASAVVFEGKAWAFSGEPGAGKSTLAAALGQHGFPLLCDDTMVLDLSDPDNPVALPGHKRLKLTPAAIAMLGGIEAHEKVDDDIDKYYVAPPFGDWDQPLPVGQLCFLDIGDDFALHPLRGAARMERLNDDHYTGWQYVRAQGRSPAQWFAFKAQLARSMPMSRFVRPVDSTRFADGVSFIAARLRERLFPQ